MNYVCFGSNNLNFVVLDKVNKKYIRVKDGLLCDDTSRIEKMYKRYYTDIEKGKAPNIKMGVLYFEYLQGKKDLTSCMIYDSDIVFQSDDRVALDKFIIQSQIEQLDDRRKCLDLYFNEVERAVGLYTYGGR